MKAPKRQWNKGSLSCSLKRISALDKLTKTKAHRFQLNMVATSDNFCNQVLGGLRRFGLSVSATRIAPDQDPGSYGCDLWLVVEDKSTDAFLNRVIPARPGAPVIIAASGKTSSTPEHLASCDRVPANDMPQLLQCLKLQLQLQAERKQRRRLTRFLATVEHQQVRLVDQADIGIALVHQLQIQYCNQRFADLLGEHDAGALIGKSLQALVNTPKAGTKASTLLTLLKRAASDDSPLQLTPSVPQTSGSLLFSISTSTHRGLPCLLARVKSAGKKPATSPARGNSGKDLITRLDNLPFFESRVERAIAAAIDDHTDSMLLVTRIDHFQRLLETIGKAATLQVLAEIAGFLDTAISKPYAATRLAIDEFAVLLFDCSTNEAARLADFIDSKVNASLLPPTADQAELGVSIGLAAINCYAHDANNVIGRARMNTGKGYQHRHEGNCATGKDGNLLDNIHNALDNHRLEPLFQPVIPFEPDSICRYLVSYRLLNNDGNELAPEAVTACANVHNLGYDIDRLLLACLMERHKPGTEEMIQYQVPLNPNTLANATLPRWLGKQLHANCLSADQLRFQVSEIDLHSNSEQVCRFCDSLTELGFKIIIGDFGSAMEPLPALAKLTPDSVQLDALLVRDLPFSRQQQQAMGKLIAAIHQQQVNVTVANLADSDLLPLVFNLGVDAIHGDCLAPRLASLRYHFPQEQQLCLAS